ncbi:hypothetical protein F4804DRAFT_113817 [Jackrogersella minutella]|nr:hypothetical protein F4804DRAFT_113817 [Jackrogersella minutella]
MSKAKPKKIIALNISPLTLSHKKERREAEDELVRLQQELQSKISEKINKLQRLRRQEDLLKERGLQLVRQGEALDDPEEMDHLMQEKSRVEAERARLDSEIAASSVLPSSFSGINFDLGPMSPSTEAFLASVGQDSGDENRQASTSRSEAESMILSTSYSSGSSSSSNSLSSSAFSGAGSNMEIWKTFVRNRMDFGNDSR